MPCSLFPTEQRQLLGSGTLACIASDLGRAALSRVAAISQEGTMKSIRSMIAALALAFVLPSAADAATTDPEVIIYRFPGVVDDGDSNSGIATIFNCTNFSGTTETVRFATRSTSGTLIGNVTVSIQHLATKTASTHNTLAFTDDTLVLQIAMLGQGTTAIAAPPSTSSARR